ncbi:hypothetical protein Y032_0260g524 [Ancylostoma ceylanicum]|uniref:Uncharacterized protein n=1 Tax=Ancylostoma ceylanicum TaxID=53326 RepID=A0A016SAF0_9BILA|nr:hypothetical protein Y032_0260g524 [Ancylostoma ceylanicum]
MGNSAFISCLPACFMLFHHCPMSSSSLKPPKFSEISNTNISVGAAFNAILPCATRDGGSSQFGKAAYLSC